MHYKVVLELELNAESPLDAAKKAQEWCSIDPCLGFHVEDSSKNTYFVNLGEDDENAVTEEDKEKIRKSLNKKVKCLTDNIEFESIKQAVIYSGISKTTFHRKLHKGELINGKKYEIY